MPPHQVKLEREATLEKASLYNATLFQADLHGADLTEADLRRIDLEEATASRAILRRATLRNAWLKETNFSGAILQEASLWGCRLWDTIGNQREIKSLHCDKWGIVYTDRMMAIGCEQHKIENWMAYDEDTINNMHEDALEWWRRWRPVIVALINTSPAEPTK